MANEATTTQPVPGIERQHRRSYRAERRLVRPKTSQSKIKLPGSSSSLQPEQMPENGTDQEEDYQEDNQLMAQEQPVSSDDRRRRLQQERRTDKQAQTKQNNLIISDKSSSKTESSETLSRSPMAALRRARQAIGGQKQAIGMSVAKEQIIAVGEQLAVQAQRAVWKIAHEALEEAALVYFWVPFLSIIPLALFGVRLFIGNLLGKMFTINVKGFELALVPSMTPPELVVRGAKALIFVVLTLVWLFILFAIVYVFQNYKEILWNLILDKLAEVINL